MFREDGFYSSMFDIHFLHPLHVGFNKFQDDNLSGFAGKNDDFSQANIQLMESLINSYLEKGFSEKIYSYNDSHFKSDITILKEGQPETFTWHDKEHMMSNKIQRFLNKSFIKSHTVKTGTWA